MTTDKWEGVTYYKVGGHWEGEPQDPKTVIVSVFVNDWQSEHAEDQPSDQDIFYSMDDGEIPKVGDNLSEFVVTKVRKMKSLVED